MPCKGRTRFLFAGEPPPRRRGVLLHHRKQVSEEFEVGLGRDRAKLPCQPLEIIGGFPGRWRGLRPDAPHVDDRPQRMQSLIELLCDNNLNASNRTSMPCRWQPQDPPPSCPCRYARLTVRRYSRIVPPDPAGPGSGASSGTASRLFQLKQGFRTSVPVPMLRRP